MSRSGGGGEERQRSEIWRRRRQWGSRGGDTGVSCGLDAGWVDRVVVGPTRVEEKKVEIIHFT
jgi:hypothetical protein